MAADFEGLLNFARFLGVGVKFGAETKFESLKGRRVYLRGQFRKRQANKLSMILALDPRSLIRSNLLEIQTEAARALAHELGHFIIAPLGRRHRTDYGIVNVRSKFAIVDENRARTIERYLCAHFGFKPGSLPDSYDKKINNLTKEWWANDGKHQVDILLDFRK